MRTTALLLFLSVAVASTASLSAQAPAPVLVIDGDAAIITLLIRPEKIATFDGVLARLKEALQKSANPQRRQQAAGWQVFKSLDRVQGNASYIMRLDPVIKGAEYDITRLVGEVFPTEIADLNRAYREAQAARSFLTMERVEVPGLGNARDAADVSRNEKPAVMPLQSFTDAEAAVVTILVRPERIDDFLATLTMVGKAMQASTVAGRKRQASGWKVFKGMQSLNGQIPFVMMLDPVQANVEYDPIRLIQETFPSEVSAMFQKYSASFAGQAIVRLTRQMQMR